MIYSWNILSRSQLISPRVKLCTSKIRIYLSLHLKHYLLEFYQYPGLLPQKYFGTCHRHKVSIVYIFEILRLLMNVAFAVNLSIPWYLILFTTTIWSLKNADTMLSGSQQELWSQWVNLRVTSLRPFTFFVSLFSSCAQQR